MDIGDKSSYHEQISRDVMLKAIKASVERDRRDYCIECGDKIPEQRVSCWCVKCKSELEKKR